MCVHFGLILHGRNVANAAAQDALTTAQVQLGTAAEGRMAGYNTLALFPGIKDANVSVQRTRNEVFVRITGRIYGPLGSVGNRIDVTRSGPVERFYFETEREQ